MVCHISSVSVALRNVMHKALNLLLKRCGGIRKVCKENVDSLRPLQAREAAIYRLLHSRTGEVAVPIIYLGVHLGVDD